MELEYDEQVKEEDDSSPLVRSLSMSRNIAQSVLGEVPHMIRLTPSDDSSGFNNPRGFHTLKKSSSASSLSRLRLLTSGSSGAQSSSSSINVKTTAKGSKILGIEIDRRSKRRVLLQSKSLAHESSVAVDLSKFLISSAYHPARSGKRNDLLVGAVVSRWDNIVGPQCVYLWTEETTSSFYPGNLPKDLSRLVKYVTDHTVDHQDVDGNHVHSSIQRSALCIVPDLSLAYMSLSIRVPSDQDCSDASTSAAYSDPDRPATTVPHAIAVLANLQYLSQFLLLRPLIFNWLATISPKIGVLLCKNKLRTSLINSWCAELCKTMTALKNCWGPESQAAICIDSSGDSPDIGRDYNTSDGKSRLLEDMDYLPPKLLPKAMWGTLLSSHLTTFGSTIVVGSDHLAINQVIRFLLCFSTHQEGYCSRYVLPTLPDTYMKGLFVQGLMLGEIGERSISFSQITSNRCPSTHVELGSKNKVRQMLPQQHRQQRDLILMQELNNLWTSTNFVSPAFDPFPNIVKDVAGFVTKFLEEVLTLPPDRRYGRLLLFRRLLHSKAIALIAYLQSIERKPKKELLKLLKFVPEALNFDDQEYLIVQVVAEKIRPGVLQFLHTKE